MQSHGASCRLPAVAGLFYPADAAQLRASVGSYLGAADVTSEEPVPKALVVPHAGYVYSGPIAGSAYARLASGRGRIRRVVLIGPAHRAYVQGLAGAGAREFARPLGRVPVDGEVIDAVRAAEPGLVVDDARAHAREHSLEVQIPFLQEVLPGAAIVPMVVSDAPPEVVGRVIERLWGGPETVIVISSDLSHYLPYPTARRVDEDTAKRILALEPEIEGERACGAAGVNGLLWVARRRGMRARVLDLRNSGDTAGGRDEVVGYGAFAFYE